MEDRHSLRAVEREGEASHVGAGVLPAVDANGMVKPTHNVSVNANPAGLESFAGARQIKALPDGLQIIQRGSNASHFEIVPRQPIKLEQFQQLTNRVEFK